MTSESPFFTVTPEEKAVKMEIKNYYDLQTALRKLAQDREGSGTAALRSGESRSGFHDQRGMRHARAGRAAPARPALELAWRQETRRGVCGPALRSRPDNAAALARVTAGAGRRAASLSP